MEETYLKIENITLWSRVGVLDQEREEGQMFSCDILLWSDFEDCSTYDDLGTTIDYSLLISCLKNHAKYLSCFTIEKYSDELIRLIKEKFNPKRIKIILTKCKPPIIGFDGKVSIVKIYKRS